MSFTIHSKMMEYISKGTWPFNKKMMSLGAWEADYTLRGRKRQSSAS